MLCSYGCGREGRYYFKVVKKWCCEKHFRKCPAQSDENQGRDLNYFYCSEECKNECPLYNSKGTDPFRDNKIPYTNYEYKQFRDYVLDRDNYKCQYCGKKAEHVHHERPQKLEPFFALDPDLAWSVCKECHYKYGHKDDCSTGRLSKVMCIGA